MGSKKAWFTVVIAVVAVVAFVAFARSSEVTDYWPSSTPSAGGRHS